MKKILLFLSFLLMSVGIWGATFQLVTNVNNLSIGDEIIIVNSASSKALGTTQNSNNRNAVSISISSNQIEPGNTVQILTLGKNNNHWTLYTGSGYLYAASSSNNYLRTQTTNNTNGEWTITISNNNATITAQGSNTRNILKYNSGSTIFSCYSSGQQPVQIFKKIGSGPIEYTVSFVNELGKNPNNITQASLGANITLPTNINICNKCYSEEWEFYGWTVDRNNNNILSNPFTPTKDTVLYALYSRRGIKDVEIEEYKLVSKDQDDWEGEYLIAYIDEFDNVLIADGRIGGGDNGTGGIMTGGTKLDPGANLTSDSTILLEYGDLYNVTIEHLTETTYGIKTKDNYYNYGTKSAAHAKSNNTTIALKHQITIEFNNKKDITIRCYDSDNDATKYMRYNTDGDGFFRFYASGQKSITLFKRQKSHYNAPIEYSTAPECDYDYISKWSTNSITLPEADLADVTNPSNITIKNINSDNTILNRTSLSSTNGEYNVTVSNLTNNSCDKINILIEGTDSMYLIYKVPIIVSSNVNTEASIFTSETGCATCDVVVLDNKTLTVSGTTSQNRDVKVYSGGTLSVPSGTTYTINSLSLRKTDNISSYLSLYGNLNLSGDSSLFLDIYTDPSDWRWLALPDAFKAKDVIKSNGKNAVFGTDYLIKTYDGNKRSIEQRNGWIMVDENKIFAQGEGFIFGITGDGTVKQEYRFKFANNLLDREKANKTLSWETLKAWGCTTEGLAPNHIGWNLIGNPYFTTLNTEIYSPIRIGHLIKDPSGDTWNGKWIVDPDETEARLRYRVVKCAPELSDDGSYRSELLDDIYLEPFECFFVQLGGNNTNPQSITLDVNKRRSVVSRYHEDADEELFLRVYVDDAKTGMFISNKFTDEYEPGDDFESRRNIYQLISGYKLLYSAINDSIIENGVHIYSSGGKVTLDDKAKKEKFAEIYILSDNSWYDLLNGDEPQVNGDFMLYAKRKLSDIPTEIDCVIDDEQYMIYDILGRRSKTSMHGIYIFKNEKSAMKIVR